jgi:hypothetical protein
MEVKIHNSDLCKIGKPRLTQDRRDKTLKVAVIANKREGVPVPYLFEG